MELLKNQNTQILDELNTLRTSSTAKENTPTLTVEGQQKDSCDEFFATLDCTKFDEIFAKVNP